MEIVKSEIKREECSRSHVEFSRAIYVNCCCGDNRHVGRVMLAHTLNKEDLSFIVQDNVYLEFNVTKAIDPTPEYLPNENTWQYYFLRPIHKQWNRLKAAWSLIRGKEVYFSSDILLEYSSADKLASAIKESIKVMKELE